MMDTSIELNILLVVAAVFNTALIKSSWGHGTNSLYLREFIKGVMAKVKATKSVSEDDFVVTGNST